jgi:hypothetical protein
MKIIAYELTSEDLPFVPEFIVLENEDVITVVFRNAEERISQTDLHGMVVKGRTKMMDIPETWREDSWPVVETGGLKWFFLSDEKRWREARAKSLLREAKDVSGDPARKLSLLAASGNMGKINISKLVSSLEKQRKSPTESLLDIYRRLEQERNISF